MRRLRSDLSSLAGTMARMVGLWLGVLLTQEPAVLALENDRLSVRVERHGGAFHEEMSVLTRAGRRPVLVSPGSARATSISPAPRELAGGWSFTSARRVGQSLVLTGPRAERVLRFSPGGDEILVNTRVSGLESARALLTSYLFLPDGRNLPPTESYAPGPTSDAGLVPEDCIRAPVVWARREELGAAVVLETTQDRPLPFALLLNGASGATLLGAGMAHVVREAEARWVWSERLARLPQVDIEWRVRIQLTSEADQLPPSSVASFATWPAFREQPNALPQVAPFADYARLTIAENGPWWSRGEVGAPVVGDASVTLGSSANLVLSAWGKRWWGQRQAHPLWVARADQMVRLALQGFRDGLPSSTFHPRTNRWETLAPGFDTREAAWTGIWLWRYALATQDEELRRETRRAAIGIARLLSARQAPGGGVPAVWTGLPGDHSDPTDAAPAVWLFHLVGMEQQALAGQNALLSQAVDQGRYGTRGGPDELQRLGWALGALLADDAQGHERAIQNVADRIAMLQRVWEPGDESQPTMSGLVAPSAGSSTAGLAEHAWVAPLLVEAGLRANRRDLAERGAMMARAKLGLFAHPLASGNGFGAPDGLLPGRASAGFRMAGRGSLGAWAGFIEGEGAVLAALAELTDRFGGAVRSRQGWVVGIDGCGVDDRGQLVDLLAVNPTPFGKARIVTVAGPGREDRSELELRPKPGVRAIRARLLREGVQLYADTSVPAQPGASGRFSTSGTAWVANWGERRFERVLPVLALDEPAVVFEGELGGARLTSEPMAVHINPDWPYPQWPDRGWRRSDGLRGSAFFSLDWWSTADRGLGLAERHLMGVVESPEFVVARERLALDLHGIPDARCWVELVEVETGSVLTRVPVAQAEVQALEWDARGFANRRLRLRLVDQARNAWVGVSRIRVAGSLVPSD